MCNGTNRPRIFYPEMTPSSSLLVVSVPVRTRQVIAAQKETLRRAFVQFKQSIKGSGFKMRSLEAVLPYVLINYIVKNARNFVQKETWSC